MKRLDLILNGKGGVGKSFFAVNFVQFLKDKGITHRQSWHWILHRLEARSDRPDSDGRTRIRVPTSVLPHIHAIIEADDFSEGMVETSRELVFHNCAQTEEPLNLPVSVKVFRIKDEEDFKKETLYLYKVVNLKLAYESAWPRFELDDRRWAWKLNSEVKDFIQAFNNLCWRRMMVRRIGNLHAANKYYLGGAQ